MTYLHNLRKEGYNNLFRRIIASSAMEYILNRRPNGLSMNCAKNLMNSIEHINQVKLK